MITRPLRYKLRAGDQLLLLHIPKTAGTTFYSFIAQNFRETEVWPLDAGPIEHRIAGGKVSNLDGYKLLRSHHDYTIYRYLNRKPVYLTMLRDPVERVISIYKHMHRDPANKVLQEVLEQGLSLEEFVQHPRAQGLVENRQVKQLAGVIQGRARGRINRLSERAMLEIALMRLDEFAFFGLVERLDESIHLLCYTFNWSIPTDYESLNIASSPSRREELSDREVKAIEEVNQLDLDLYNHAVQLFDSRFKMVEEVQPFRIVRSVPKPEKISRRAVMLPDPAPPQALRNQVVGWLGKIRRRIIPEGSEIEVRYLRLRKRYFGW